MSLLTLVIHTDKCQYLTM